MNKYLIISSTVLIIFLIVLAIILIILPKKSNQEIKDECRILIKNSGNKKINIVYLTENVDEKEINKSIEFFLSSFPYFLNKNKFNFYYAGTANCSRIEDFILCYSRNILEKSAFCPNEYIVVLSNQSQEIRSSAYINIMSININNAHNIILHEFGHVFTNLADEYVPSIIPRGSKNCNKKCPVYQNISGCFEGCSEKSYKRSSEDSIMKSPKTSDYKELNELLIKNNLDKYE